MDRSGSTGIEVVVLAGGWVPGGTVGMGTARYALTIGPLVQLFLRWVAVRLPAAGVRPYRNADSGLSR